MYDIGTVFDPFSVLLLSDVRICMEKSEAVFLRIISVLYAILIGIFFKESHINIKDEKLDCIIELIKGQEAKEEDQKQNKTSKETAKRRIYSAFL